MSDILVFTKYPFIFLTDGKYGNNENKPQGKHTCNIDRLKF